jgi:hypothetical protein
MSLKFLNNSPCDLDVRLQVQVPVRTFERISPFRPFEHEADHWNEADEFDTCEHHPC